jgi:hypothetical protein
MAFPNMPPAADDVKTINMRMRNLQGPRLRHLALTLLPTVPFAPHIIAQAMQVQQSLTD